MSDGDDMLQLKNGGGSSDTDAVTTTVAATGGSGSGNASSSGEVPPLRQRPSQSSIGIRQFGAGAGFGMY